MIRAYLALFSAPLLVSTLFGIGAPIVAVITLALTVCIAAPLLFFFRRRGWVNWWHTVLAGVGIGLIFSALFVGASNDEWADRSGLQSTLMFCGVGAATALLFWWTGIFRNSKFLSVPRSIPYSMLWLIPIVILGLLIQRSFRYEFLEGRILTVAGTAPSRSTTVRLSSGSIVKIPFDGDDRADSALLNQCWHVSYHWSTKRFSHVYSLDSPFGGDANEC